MRIIPTMAQTENNYGVERHFVLPPVCDARLR